MHCPFCREKIHATDNPLRFSGQHDLGCARCYRTPPLKLARKARPAKRGYSLYPKGVAA